MNAAASTAGTGPVLFVYYKIEQTKTAALLPLVCDFQQRLLQAWPGLSCELMQRPAVSAEGLRTWMEVYRHSEGLGEAAIEAIAALARELQLPAPRLSELFVPL